MTDLHMQQRGSPSTNPVALKQDETAKLSKQLGHHPDLLDTYNSCTVSYGTHSVGGLPINDFICAAKINAAQTL